MDRTKKWRTIARNGAVVVVSATFIVFLFRLTEAGSLTPDVAPASTMNDTEEVYNALVGTFDSSSITASASGSALEISRCIIEQLTGGTCP